MPHSIHEACSPNVLTFTRFRRLARPDSQGVRGPLGRRARAHRDNSELHPRLSARRQAPERRWRSFPEVHRQPEGIGEPNHLFPLRERAREHRTATSRDPRVKPILRRLAPPPQQRAAPPERCRERPRAPQASSRAGPETTVRRSNRNGPGRPKFPFRHFQDRTSIHPRSPASWTPGEDTHYNVLDDPQDKSIPTRSRDPDSLIATPSMATSESRPPGNDHGFCSRQMGKEAPIRMKGEAPPFWPRRPSRFRSPPI